MIKKAEGSPCFLLYQTFPGIGALTAALLLGELGDITRFKTHKQLNALSESTSDGIIQVSILAKTASISVVIPKHGKLFSSPFEI